MAPAKWRPGWQKMVLVILQRSSSVGTSPSKYSEKTSAETQNWDANGSPGSLYVLKKCYRIFFSFVSLPLVLKSHPSFQNSLRLSSWSFYNLMLGSLHLAKYILKHFCDFVSTWTLKFNVMNGTTLPVGSMAERVQTPTREVLPSALGWKDGEV